MVRGGAPGRVATADAAASAVAGADATADGALAQARSGRDGLGPRGSRAMLGASVDKLLLVPEELESLLTSGGLLIRS